MTIDQETLAALGACSDGQSRFRWLFAEPVEVSVDACLLALDQDPTGFAWVARRLFPEVRWNPLLKCSRLVSALKFCELADRAR